MTSTFYSQPSNACFTSICKKEVNFKTTSRTSLKQKQKEKDKNVLMECAKKKNANAFYVTSCCLLCLLHTIYLQGRIKEENSLNINHNFYEKKEQKKKN